MGGYAMVIVLAVFITIIGVAIACIFSMAKTRKRKYIVWGIVNIFIIGPSLSFAIGLTYAIIERNGWAAMLMWIIYPIIFLFGLIQIIIGIFMKNTSDNNINQIN